MSGSLYQLSLYPSSFNGVPFNCTSWQNTSGRRTVLHEFVMRDEPFNEDLGKASSHHSITGYLVGDDVAFQQRALEDAADTVGPGILVHPTKGPISISLTQPVEFVGTSKGGRMIEFTLHYVETTQAGGLNNSPFADVGIDTGANILDAGAQVAEASHTDFLSSVGGYLREGQRAVQGIQNKVAEYTGYANVVMSNVRRVFGSVRMVSNLVAPGLMLGRYNSAASSTLLTFNRALSAPQRFTYGVASSLAIATRAGTTVTNSASNLLTLVGRL